MPETEQKRKTILVTGAAGFIGAFLCKRLVAEDRWRVAGLDNLNSYYSPALKRERLDMVRAADKNNLFDFAEVDLCDEAALAEAFARWQPAVVVNLAAQAGVRYSLEAPRGYISSNIVGFFNVLDLCRVHNVEHLVYASSSSVYGDTAASPFSETEPCNEPVSIYAATKRADELMAAAYAKLHGLPCTGLRFFTVYGPMGRPDMAYFSFADTMADGGTIRLFEGGALERDFTYVDDIVEGICRIVEQGCKPSDPQAPHRVLNIGHGSPVVIRDFVDELEAALRDAGLNPCVVRYETAPMQPGDVHRTFADTSALAELYGYEPSTSLAEGLRAFAQWYVPWRQG